MTRSKTEVRAKAELPDAVYAAAGASDLAYKRLRHLPEATARTLRTAGQTAGALRERLVGRERELTAELSQMRATAKKRAESLAARAAKAQEQAVAGYKNLVAHGEQVVNERFGATTGHAEPTKVEVIVGEPHAEEPETPPEPETPAAPAGPPTTTAPRKASGETPRGASKAGTRAPTRRTTV